jgi:hypothetical protein
VKTIHQIGDFGWFSERKTKGKYGSVLQALRSHIKYIESKAVASFNSAENIFAKAKEELKKRWDSRIALKFFIAVPKNWQPEEALANVVAFVSKELNLPFDHIAAYYHASDSNPHVHLLIYPRDRQGKKLRIGRRELKEFHRAWDELLQDLGYELKKYRDGIKLERLRLTDKNAFELPNLPVFLIEKDAELRAAYEEYIKLRNEVAEELEELDDELRHEVEKTEPTDLSIREKIGEFFRNLVNKGFKEKQLEQIKTQLKVLGFKPSDRLAVVLVGEGKKTLQRLITAETLLSDRFLAFLRAKNSEGYNIYITLNKLKPSAKDRKRDSFDEKQRTIYLDIDGDKLGVNGLELLKRIIREQKLPPPSLVIHTSQDNYQVVWVLKEERHRNQLERVMKKLSELYGLDYTQDVARVFRLAGFFNRKPEKKHLVEIDASTSTFEEVEFEAFEKLLSVSAIKQRAKELKTKIRSYDYSKTIDAYLNAVWEVFNHDLMVLNRCANLAEAIERGEKRFQSLSEFELALLHAIKKSVDNRSFEYLSRKFEEILKIVRPGKLKRNKKYVELTVKKVLAGSEVLKGLKSKRTLEEKEERNSTFPQPYREPIRPIRKKREKEREEEELELLRKEIEKHEEEEREINTHLMLEEQFIDEELEELLRKYKDENKTKRRERGRDWDFGPSL